MLTHLPPYVTDEQVRAIILEVESMASRMEAKGRRSSARKLRAAAEALQRELDQRSTSPRS